MKLQTRITLLIIAIVIISIAIIVFFTSSWITEKIETETKTNILNVAEMTANSPTIISALKAKDTQLISTHVNQLLSSVDKIQYITIADMDDIRYSHPNPKQIGEHFVGGDEDKVLKYGKTYVSVATGTLGKSWRAFVPIYDTESKTQIGFVSVGTLSQSVDLEVKTSIKFLILITIVGLVAGITGAFLLARNIKNTLLGLEPEEISRLYSEKIAILDTVYEGIVAIDDNGIITLINDSALSIVNLKSKYKKSELIGKYIEEIIPTSQLIEVLKLGTAQYSKEQSINKTIVMTNRVPIKNKGKIVGAMASFRDKTEITKLAEELTGVKQIIEALRANNHEFMNKLHVILGLIHMKDLDEAKKYITTVTNKQQKLLDMVTNKIKDPTIGGLVLGKFSRAGELGIHFKVDESSWLDITHNNISNHSLVTIIGNLIENAMAAANKNTIKEKYVYLKIEETDKLIKIEVEDSGIGIEKDNFSKVFEKGYTTKSGSEGVGLAILKETVLNLKGTININSAINEGTLFTIVLPKKNV